VKFERAMLQTLPKVLLHEHLDGVLRPESVIDLARREGYRGLPTEDPQALAQWFHQGATQGSLAKYLEGFAHTIAVMQTEEALERVAYEQAEDLSKDGVIYFESRFAPIFHTAKGLTHQQIVSAVLKGLERGRKDFGVSSGLIICAMRNMDVSLEMAELAVDSVSAAWWVLTWPVKRAVTRPRNTSTHSTTSSVKISISQFTPARDTARNQYGKLSNTAVPTALATEPA
jgi:adenosine deaminase